MTVETASSSFPMLGALLTSFRRALRRVLILAALLAFVFVALQWLQLHLLLAALHPALAWSASGVFAGGVTLAGVWMSWRWRRLPRVLRPPELPETASEWSPAQREAFLRFVQSALARLEQHPRLPAEVHAKLPGLGETLASAPSVTDSEELVQRVEEGFDAALAPLDELASKEIWRAARDVALLTALTPSALLDVGVTLVRNAELVVRVAQIYDGRPGIRGSLRVMRDVLTAALTAGVAERVAEGAGELAADAFGSVGARLIGPAGQGLANGLITLRLGRAAQRRCRSLRRRRTLFVPWSLATWKENSRKLAKEVGGRVAPELQKRFLAAAETAWEAGTHPLRRGWEGLKKLF